MEITATLRRLWVSRLWPFTATNKSTHETHRLAPDARAIRQQYRVLNPQPLGQQAKRSTQLKRLVGFLFGVCCSLALFFCG